MRINYLTWLKKDLAKETEEIQLPHTVETLEALFDHMMTLGEPYNRVFKKRHVIFAETSGKVIAPEDSIKSVQEMSFFSPIVGG